MPRSTLVAGGLGAVLVVASVAVLVSRAPQSSSGYRLPDRLRWHRVQTRIEPPAREEALLSYDPATNQLLLVDGVNDLEPVGQPTRIVPQPGTWLFTGSNWRELPAPTPPFGLTLAYDKQATELLLVASSTASSSNVPLSTWRWTGSTWLPVGAPATITGGLYGTVIAYDQATRQMLCTGGAIWALRGNSWAQLPGRAPLLNRAAYDPAGRSVLAAFAQEGVTWAWTGRAWRRAPGSRLPAQNAPLDSSNWITDPAYGTVLTVGQYQTTNDGSPTAILAWSGRAWRPIPSGSLPPGVDGDPYQSSIAYYPPLRQVVLFGAGPGEFTGPQSPSLDGNETWLLGPP